MTSSTIYTSIHARQIYDSRGKPTLEVEVHTTEGGPFRSAIPSGASTGIYEAIELRDGIKSEFHGQGVSNAINNVNTIIAPFLLQKKIAITEQRTIDNALCDLDGTLNKSKLGANAILGVSLASAVAAAQAKNLPLFAYLGQLAGTSNLKLPTPSFNVINGGSHAGNSLAFQEFMIIPIGAETFSEAMKMGSEIYQLLKIMIKSKYGQNAINVGDEGGFAPDINSVEDCLDLIVNAINTAGLKDKVKIALDVAASEFHMKEKPGYYDLDNKSTAATPHKILHGKELAGYYLNLIQKYPIISIEDPFDQDDWDSWCYLTANTTIQIVADDLTVTNPKRIKMAIERRACNALLLKVNQIGTLTESLDAAKLAQSAGWNIMVSHRSGETEDSFIADLAVGLGAKQIKSGAPCRSERLAKYNQLLRYF